MIFLFLNAAYAESTCLELHSSTTFSASIDAATMAFVQRDTEKLHLQIEQLETMLPCLQDPITPTLAATFHLTEGMFFSISGEKLKAQQSFAISKSIDSSIEFPEYIYPKGHPIQVSFETTPAAKRNEIASPTKEIWYFDGLANVGRPIDTPTIFQVTEHDTVIYSSYLTPYSDLNFEPRRIQKDHRSRNLWLLTAGSVLSASFAMTSRSNYFNAGTRPMGLYLQNQVFVASFGYCSYRLIKTLFQKEK